jgi:hypothetical protein
MARVINSQSEYYGKIGQVIAYTLDGLYWLRFLGVVDLVIFRREDLEW